MTDQLHVYNGDSGNIVKIYCSSCKKHVGANIRIIQKTVCSHEDRYAFCSQCGNFLGGEYVLRVEGVMNGPCCMPGVIERTLWAYSGLQARYKFGSDLKSLAEEFGEPLTFIGGTMAVEVLKRPAERSPKLF